MSALRPLAWGLVAASAGLAALALRPAPAPVPTMPAAEAAAPPPLHVFKPAPVAAPQAATAAPADPALGLPALREQLARDPAAALPALEALAARQPALALPLYEQLLAHWAQRRQHPLAVQALARAPLDADTRERLLQPLLAHWAETTPDQAARWAQATPGQAGLLAPLHDRWLQQDARSATVFASMLPAGETRGALLADGWARWAAQDGPAARDWLRSQGPQPALDEALARHASGDELARHAPLEALDLVARIADPDRRRHAWQALAQSLHDIDPAQVAPLLARAPGLWPAEQAQLLAGLH
ncbi:hypothetical protein NYO99_08130 [Pelomonas sp. UHG3]|uniref:Uncharacterized protein n=1 Tax=Roseateles hydrophilus TaxID=2975054 RepID=A0ACC6C9H8_9BURK|nr:hypothetical protein [Pelomonas sp. UHG3]MCY4744935.1 hypothetical protein [Pelomonas sp. UHG3]